MSERLCSNDRVVAITATDEWCHPGRVSELIACARSGEALLPKVDRDGVDPARFEVEFYDAVGRPLRPILDVDYQLVGFAVNGAPAPALVETRVRAALERLLVHAAGQSAAHAHGCPASLPAEGDLPALLEWRPYEDPDLRRKSWFRNLFLSLFR